MTPIRPGPSCARPWPSGRARATTSSTTMPSGRASRSSCSAAPANRPGTWSPGLAGAAAVASAAGSVHPDVDAFSASPRGPGGCGGAGIFTPGRSLLAAGDRHACRARSGTREHALPQGLCPHDSRWASRPRRRLPARRHPARPGRRAASKPSNMRLCSASARRRLGELIGGDRGQAEIARADQWMTDQKIQNPARMASMILAKLN